jgi:acyl carrier protein
MNNEEKHLGSDPEDIDDVLRLIEKSYGIRFHDNELGHIRTFGQLTDHIISKIKLDNIDDCTNQQAFYKLRTAILEIKKIDTTLISPSALLADIFPRRTRRAEIRGVENILQLDLRALRPRHFVTNSLIIIVLLSILGLFFNWQFGLVSLFLSMAGLWISEKTGREFRDITLRELTDRMTQTNYTKSRRQPGTMNLTEIHGKIEKIFVENLGLEEKTIDKDTVIV